jgi:hypothetical protein
MPRHVLGASLALAATIALAGCAIRYDQTGVSRVGVFLWGLGDPPGVKWDLDWPRREVPELPATARRDALPSFEPARAPDPLLVPTPNGNAPERSSRSFDDYRDRVPRRAPESTPAPVVPRAGDRRGGDVRS